MANQAPAGQSQWEANLSQTLICPECNENPPNLEEEFSSGDMVCGSCGLVLGDRIVDTRSEWRTFSNDDQGNDDPSRVGEAENPLLTGSHLQTTIAYGDGNSKARDLLRAQGKQTNDKKDKTLLAAYKEIGAHCDAVGIPKTTTEHAKLLYKMADDAKLFKGKSTEAVIATCIFIACRRGGIGRSFKELNIMTNVSKKEIGRTFKALDKYIRENSGHVNSLGAPEQDTKQATTAEDLCIRFCSQLGLRDQSYTKISQGLAKASGAILSTAGRSPLSVAAACIYMATCLLGNMKSPKEIGMVVGVSDGTIRNAYKHLYTHRDTIVDPAWIANGKGSLANLPVS